METEQNDVTRRLCVGGPLNGKVRVSYSPHWQAPLPGSPRFESRDTDEDVRPPKYPRAVYSSGFIPVERVASLFSTAKMTEAMTLMDRRTHMIRVWFCTTFEDLK